MKYYSENQVKKLLKEQIRICSFTFDDGVAPMAKLPKGKEGRVYSYKQLNEIRNYDSFRFDRLDFHLD